MTFAREAKSVVEASINMQVSPLFKNKIDKFLGRFFVRQPVGVARGQRSVAQVAGTPMRIGLFSREG
jgi:hypothetical protein